MKLEQSKNIFFLGIKGVAMANLAVILKKLGKNVTGCDVDEEFITDKLLKDNNIGWQNSFRQKSLLAQTDLFVFSAAHGGTNNPMALEAKTRGIKLISQVQLLAEMMKSFENKIAVCGCHGKTTTSSLLVYALNKLNQKPSYLVGVPFFSGLQGGNFQDKKYFVVEADEYGVNPPSDKTPKFHLLKPNYIIATNIDFDHPDVYKDIDETKKAFKKFFENNNLNTTVPRLLFCADDTNLMEVAKSISIIKFITYGESDKSDYQITNIISSEDETSFTIKKIGKFGISIFGKHNVLNATAVVVQLLGLGFKPNDIRNAIKGFKGAERRFEQIYFKNNIYLFDDYAHHQSEIAATINAAKSRFPDKRIVIIFQPHTYSRTKNLLKEFAKSLSLADICIILPIFASARENADNFKVSSEDIARLIKDSFNKDCLYSSTNVQLTSQLDMVIQPGDVVFTMGAGDVYKLKDEIIKIINTKSEITNKVQKSKIKNKNDSLKIKGLRIEKNKDLSQFNTLRSSAFAEYFLEAGTREDLIKGKKFALNNNLPVFILAGGSNLALISDIKGLVIKNNYKNMKVVEENDRETVALISSGYPVSLLVSETVKKGLEGFEYHKGLPGTVGGAVYMNSKWTRPVNYFGDRLVSAFLVDESGRVKEVARDYFQFSYDFSQLQTTNEILLEAVFRLKKTDPKILAERAESAFLYRQKTQPMGAKTSGCFFKNINGKSAGQMIDQAGLKGFAVGDFFVSPIHANFIINKGKGQTKDLLTLIKIIKEKVKLKFAVELEEEVIVI